MFCSWTCLYDCLLALLALSALFALFALFHLPAFIPVSLGEDGLDRTGRGPHTSVAVSLHLTGRKVGNIGVYTASLACAVVWAQFDFFMYVFVYVCVCL